MWFVVKHFCGLKWDVTCPHNSGYFIDIYSSNVPDTPSLVTDRPNKEAHARPKGCLYSPRGPRVVKIYQIDRIPQAVWPSFLWIYPSH